MLVRAPDGHERKLRFSELAHRFTPQFGDSRDDSSRCNLNRTRSPDEKGRRLRQFLFYFTTFEFLHGK